ncbi:hypothetical protein BST83_13250 [Polaribacter filamentus]|uniref:Uncharacterized protein n=1 Tax=Polaribacter filamentus TaxID=53483 RepID=A0A2S7KZG0_9FLAO|nr:hypothetical protein [Polaribacter filamentus]PQB08010.1 hypothetical protein BST83_13250 [Polaribacter filamentus]
MEVILKVVGTKKTKNGVVNYWKVVNVDGASSVEKEIADLKSKKASFKIVEKTVEKTHTFNGNNYVITTKMLKK